jgi:hypothetical protein
LASGPVTAVATSHLVIAIYSGIVDGQGLMLSRLSFRRSIRTRPRTITSLGVVLAGIGTVYTG